MAGLVWAVQGWAVRGKSAGQGSTSTLRSGPLRVTSSGANRAHIGPPTPRRAKNDAQISRARTCAASVSDRGNIFQAMTAIRHAWFYTMPAFHEPMLEKLGARPYCSIEGCLLMVKSAEQSAARIRAAQFALAWRCQRQPDGRGKFPKLREAFSSTCVNLLGPCPIIRWHFLPADRVGTVMLMLHEVPKL